MIQRICVWTFGSRVTIIIAYRFIPEKGGGFENRLPTGVVFFHFPLQFPIAFWIVALGYSTFRITLFFNRLSNASVPWSHLDSNYLPFSKCLRFLSILHDHTVLNSLAFYDIRNPQHPRVSPQFPITSYSPLVSVRITNSTTYFSRNIVPKGFWIFGPFPLLPVTTAHPQRT